MRSFAKWSAFLVLLVASTSLFAQGLGTKKIWNLTIMVDVSGASIYVDNKLIQGNTTQVPESMHNVKVRAPGYADFSTNVNVTKDTTLPVRLVARSYPLTLSTNVQGAQVSIDGVLLTGPIVSPWGTHTLTVSAPGYQDYTVSINVTGPTALQVALQPLGVLLSVNSNVQGADILVNNVDKGSTPYSEYLPPGTYALRVTADGYADFMTSVALSRATTINAVLQPRLFPLTLNLNVQSPVVFIDGVRVTGTPNVGSGQHTIKISAPGYQDYTGTFVANGPTGLQIVLNPLLLQLSVNANVSGASVMVNNVAKGAAPYSESLPLGTYAIRVSADGFLDYLATISLDRPVALNVQLQPKPVVPATLAVVIPQAFLDPTLKPNDPQGSVKVWVDDKLVNPKREMAGIQLAPGKHRIRLGSGAFQIQLGDYLFQQGTSYTLEVGMTVVVKTPPTQQ